MEYIIRPCFKRPEMLYFSLQYEAQAREHVANGKDIVTVFSIDPGGPPEMIQVINNFPYPKKIVQYTQHIGGIRNMLESLKIIVNDMGLFTVYIEDDVLVHRDYFAFLQDNIDALQVPHTWGIYGGMYPVVEEPNLGFFERVPQNITLWGSCITREFIQHFLSLPVQIVNGDMNVILPTGRSTGGDGWMQFVAENEKWRTLETYINRFLNIGIYGNDFFPTQEFPINAPFEVRKQWLAEHIQRADWWQYCHTMHDIMRNHRGLNILPPTITHFNPLLDTWKLKDTVQVQEKKEKTWLDTLWPETKPQVAPNNKNWFNPGNARLLSRLLNKNTKCVVEIGTWLGTGSTKHILSVAPNAIVLAIDHWKGTTEEQNPSDPYHYLLPILYDTFLVNTWNYKDRLYPLKMNSLDGLKLISQKEYAPDLIYIDGDHHYESVKNDIELSLDLFPEAIIVGDDWGWGDGLPIQKAVKDVASAYNLDIILEDNWAWQLKPKG